MVGQNRASSSTVLSELRTGATGTDHVLNVINRSDESIVVTSVTLYDCENIQGSCTTRRLNIRIPAGGQAMILRIRPRFDDKPSGFQSRFSWTVERQPEPAPAIERAPVREAIAEPKQDTVGRAVERPGGVADPGVRDMIDDAIKADSLNDRVVDTLIVTPGMVAIKAGDSVPVGRAVAVAAHNAAGRAIPGVRVRIRIETGDEYARVANGMLLGLKAGSAVLLVEPPRPTGTTGGEPKGASRVLVRVTP
jgi:hypothetical protein